MLSIKQTSRFIIYAALVLIVTRYGMVQAKDGAADLQGMTDQKSLVNEHADCAGFLYAVYHKQINAQSNADKPAHPGVAQFKYHADFGLKYSVDKSLFQSEIESAIKRFRTEVITLGDQKKIEKLYDQKESACIRLNLATAEYLRSLKKGK